MSQPFENGHLEDILTNAGLPSQVDQTAFSIGENLASTPGEVVWKTELLELIQYKPTTAHVHAVPIFGIPPQINKYYLFDLTAEKSMISHLVEQGFQCFWVSWKNPNKADRHYGMTDYVEHLIDAMDVVRSISGAEQIHVSGACSGGITLATTASFLAAENDDRIKSLSFQVCVLDPQPHDTELARLTSQKSLEQARRSSRKKGILKGDDLARTFAWMRPNDLVWNYVVNNYLLGEDPPAFDILYWNSDTTNLTAALHSDFLDINLNRPFANPGSFELAGHTVDLTQVTQDTFIVGGLTDHITPWQACYRTTKLLGASNVEFILSSSGHIQALINPPSNPKAKYYRNPKLPDTPNEWLEEAILNTGSWWEMWVDWLRDRSGPKKRAPKSLGSSDYPTLYPAPGEYVREKA